MAKVAFEDLSGTSTPVTSNPYDGLILACHGDPVSSATATFTNTTDNCPEIDPGTVFHSSTHPECPAKGEDLER